MPARNKTTRNADATAAHSGGDRATKPGGGQRVGYARASTRAQDLALQLDALERAGCERVYKDVGSGTIRRRPQLDACLDYLPATRSSSGASTGSGEACGISSSSSETYRRARSRSDR